MSDSDFIESIRCEYERHLKLHNDLKKKASDITKIFERNKKFLPENARTRYENLINFQGTYPTKHMRGNFNVINFITNIINQIRNPYSLQNNYILNYLKQFSLFLGIRIEVRLITPVKHILISFGPMPKSQEAILKFNLDQANNLIPASQLSANYKSFEISSESILTSSYNLVPKLNYIHQASQSLKQYFDNYISENFRENITKIEKLIILQNLPILDSCIICSNSNNKITPCRACKFPYCQSCLTQKIEQNSKKCDFCSFSMIPSRNPKKNPKKSPDVQKIKLFSLPTSSCKDCPQSAEELSTCKLCGSFNINPNVIETCETCNFFLKNHGKNFCDFCESLPNIKHPN